MSVDSSLFPILANFLVQLPLFLVWAAGLVLAIIRWQQHPKVSLLALVGIAILFIDALIGAFLNVQVPLLFSGWDWGASQIGTFFMVKGIIQAIVAAVGYGLLLVALFGWRSQADSLII